MDQAKTFPSIAVAGPLGQNTEGEGRMGMSSAEKKTWLNRYRLAGLAVQRLTEEIARWEAQAASLTARYGEASGSSGEDSLQRAVEKMLELRDELAAELRRQLTIRREIEEAIRVVEDERLQELLRPRYIEGLTWDKVAERIGYSYRQTMRVHGRALKDILS